MRVDAARILHVVAAAEGHAHVKGPCTLSGAQRQPCEHSDTAEGHFEPGVWIHHPLRQRASRLEASRPAGPFQMEGNIMIKTASSTYCIIIHTIYIRRRSRGRAECHSSSTVVRLEYEHVHVLLYIVILSLLITYLNVLRMRWVMA